MNIRRLDSPAILVLVLLLGMACTDGLCVLEFANAFLLILLISISPTVAALRSFTVHVPDDDVRRSV